jgi:hypothetical protein
LPISPSLAPIENLLKLSTRLSMFAPLQQKTGLLVNRMCNEDATVSQVFRLCRMRIG